MDARLCIGVLGLLALPAAGPVAAQTPDSLPEGVTEAMIGQGRKIFRDPGLCHACHGQAGKGGVGPDLTDRQWLHIDGSYQAIAAQIRTGVPADKSKSGAIMPPRGGASISEDNLQAVAAYVWSLSR
ncbi:MAG: cytochrome c [Gemmatimonadales bacterium]